MENPMQPPHPERNPQYSKADYIRNGVFAYAKVELALYLGEGASLQETAILAGQLQQCLQRAYHLAIQEAGLDIAGPSPAPPEFGEGLDPNNPFLDNSGE